MLSFHCVDGVVLEDQSIISLCHSVSLHCLHCFTLHDMYYYLVTLSNIKLYYMCSEHDIVWFKLFCCLCCTLLSMTIYAALLSHSSPCILICNTHLSSCLLAAFCHPPRAHLNVALCLPLPLASFFSSLAGGVGAALASGMVPPVEPPEKTSSTVRLGPTSPNLDNE